jgi:hypothetical protein
VLVAVGALAGIDQAVLADTGLDWSGIFPDDESVVLSARTWEDDGDAAPGDDRNVIVVTATRGPILTGLCPVTASVTCTEPTLLGIRLLVGDDVDQSGIIETAEWQQVATATAGPNGNGSAAALGPVSVSTGHQAYRLEHTWTWGISWDDIRERDLN